MKEQMTEKDLTQDKITQHSPHYLISLLKQNKNTTALFLVPVFIIILTIVVFCFLPTTYTYGSPELEPVYWQRSEGKTEGILLEGAFTAEKRHINALSFMIDNASENIATEGDITITLLDREGTLLGSQTLPISEIAMRHFQPFVLDVDCNVGELYRYCVTVSGSEDAPVCMGLLAATSAEAGEDDEAMRRVEVSPIIQYIYQDSMNAAGAAPYIVCILIVAVILSCILTDGGSLQRKGLIYVLAFAAAGLLLLMGDEGREPLRLNGSELRSSTASAVGEQLLIYDESGYSGIMGSTEDMILEKGVYTIGVIHTTSLEGSYLSVWDNGVLMEEFPIVPSSNYSEYTFRLERDCGQFRAEIHFSGKGNMMIREFTLRSEGRFYNDVYFVLFVLLLLAAAGIILYRRNERQPFAKESLLTACVVLGFGILAGYPYFSANLIGADDLAYHLVRIEGLKGAILEGQFPVVIHPEGLQGNGYLASMYPHMFLYIAALLRIAGVSMALSYKTMMFLANIATAYVTYIALKSMTSSRTAMYMGTALYVLLPYRFTNIYARGAVGEALALTFFPLIIAGFYHVLLADKKKWYYLVIGFTGVLQSHVLSMIFMAVIFGAACLVWVKDLLREKRWLYLCKAAGLTVLLNLWFAVPFVFFYFKESLSMQSLAFSNYAEYAINPSFFLETLDPESNRYLSFGIPIVALAGISVIKMICEGLAAKLDKYLAYLFTAGCVLSFMLTGYFAAEDFMEIGIFEKLFTMIQFPWRLFGPAAALFLFAGSIWLVRSKLLGRYAKTIAIVLVGINLLSGLTVPNGNDNFAYEKMTDTHSTGHESKITGIPKSDATIVEPYEWRIHSVMDHQLRVTPLASDSELVTIESFEKEGTHSFLTYTASVEGQYIEFPIMNYIGYQAKDENGRQLPIETGDEGRLRVPLYADGKEHSITVRYAGLFLFKAAAAVSLITYIMIIGAWIFRKRKGAEDMMILDKE